MDHLLLIFLNHFEEDDVDVDTPFEEDLVKIEEKSLQRWLWKYLRIKMWEEIWEDLEKSMIFGEIVLFRMRENLGFEKEERKFGVKMIRNRVLGFLVSKIFAECGSKLVHASACIQNFPTYTIWDQYATMHRKLLLQS